MAGCENCVFKNYSEKHPDKLISRIWKWHTSWCPGWKKYQRELQKSENPAVVRVMENAPESEISNDNNN